MKILLLNSKCLLNPFQVTHIIYTLVFLLYILQLSGLYNIDCFYFAILLTVLLYFSIASLLFTLISRDDLHALVATLVKVNFSKHAKAINSTAPLLIFFVGLVGTICLYKISGVTLFQQNKINRLTSQPGLVHYLGYLRVFLSYYVPLGYLVIRAHESLLVRFSHFVFVLVSIVLLGLNMNRGDFTFPLLGILYIELAYCLAKERLSAFYIRFGCLILISIFFFNLIGNLRLEFVMENIYHTNISSFYDMSKYPSWFVWIYIYLTSPLENFRHIVEEQTIMNHSFGLLSAYPFFQLLFKINGENLGIFSSQVYPYLESSVGLNVSSFMKDAVIDFGYFGIFFYITVFFIIMRIALILSYKNVYGYLSLVMALNIAIWGIFDNSLAIGPFIIGYFMFILLSFLSPKRFLSLTDN